MNTLWNLRTIAIGLMLPAGMAYGGMNAPAAAVPAVSPPAAIAIPTAIPTAIPIARARPAAPASAPIVAQQPPQPGMVWVNTASKNKAFHREGTTYFGKTKQGKFMTESDAVAAGFHDANVRQRKT